MLKAKYSLRSACSSRFTSSSVCASEMASASFGWGSQRSYHASMMTNYKTMKVLWGSQTGTATGFAEELAKEATSKGLPTTSIDLRKYTPKKLGTEKEPLVFILANFGTGEPTDNAKPFYDWLMHADRLKEKDNGTYKDVKYTIFGLGQSKTYPQCYQAVGKKVEARMGELGARKIFDRGEGDDSGSIEDDWTDWKEKFLEQVMNAKEEAAATAATAAPKVAAPSAKIESKPTLPQCLVEINYLDKSALVKEPYKPSPHEPISINNPIELPVIDNKELQSPLSTRSTHHIELDLRNKNTSYTTGDYLGIFPRNEDKVVQELCQLLNADPNQVISIKNLHDPDNIEVSKPKTIAEHFYTCVDVTSKPKKAILNQLAQFATDEQIKKKIPSEEYMAELNLEKKGIMDVIRDNKLKIPLDHFIDIAPTLQPRYYSISSSSEVYPSKIQLTVSLAKAPKASGGEHLGVCSHYLHDRVAGEPLKAFVKTSLFRLPQKVLQPIIMMAVGCGIAPFHGFLQHRRHQCEKEHVPFDKCKNVLYYGANHSKKDFLYQDEFREHQRIGLLDLKTAFYEEEKMFVQHRMMENMQQLWDLITKEEANAYICGHTMLFDGVKGALYRVFTEVGGMSGDEANEMVVKLQKDGRLQIDVY